MEVKIYQGGIRIEEECGLPAKIEVLWHNSPPKLLLYAGESLGSKRAVLVLRGKNRAFIPLKSPQIRKRLEERFSTFPIKGELKPAAGGKWWWIEFRD